MIPLRDDNPTRTFAFVTLLLIVANVAVFAYELTLPGQPQLESLVATYAMVPATVVSAPTLPAYGTVFTSMFLHGGFLHLAGNMLFLWIFGNNIEDAVGHVRFIGFYLLCGVAAAAAHIAAQPASTIPTLGASGAISGVLGAYLLLYPRAGAGAGADLDFSAVHLRAGLADVDRVVRPATGQRLGDRRQPAERRHRVLGAQRRIRGRAGPDPVV